MKKFNLYILFIFFVSFGIVQAQEKKPNIILVFVDDLGYGDLSCYGSNTIKTPNIDKMAEEGIKFTNFYAQTVCGPSRAALMTGSYPLRIATQNNVVEIHPHVHSKEITIAEILKDAGYASMAIGKWDLAGHSQTNYSTELLPIRQGFDTFFGTPGSNDATVNLIRNEEVVENNADMSTLTKRYTDEAISFIKQNKEKPFFVYLAHTMPHIRLEVSEEFKGKSEAGLYGDVVQELDWHVGRILKSLKEEGLDENTYVIFTSDNGPWYLGRSKGHLKRIGKDAESHGGSAGSLRGAKTSTWEGGLRVPCIIRAHGKVEANSINNQVTSTMDLLPTFSKLAGGKTPTDRVIDGRDITSSIHIDSKAIDNTKPFYYYRRTRLEAVRLGKWKLFVPIDIDKDWEIYSKAKDVIDIKKPLLFNLDDDIGETKDVSNAHPKVLEELLELIEWARNDIGDYNRIGENARFFDSEPRRLDIIKEK